VNETCYHTFEGISSICLLPKSATITCTYASMCPCNVVSQTQGKRRWGVLQNEVLRASRLTIRGGNRSFIIWLSQNRSNQQGWDKRGM